MWAESTGRGIRRRRWEAQGFSHFYENSQWEEEAENRKEEVTEMKRYKRKGNRLKLKRRAQAAPAMASLEHGAGLSTQLEEANLEAICALFREVISNSGGLSLHVRPRTHFVGFLPFSSRSKWHDSLSIFSLLNQNHNTKPTMRTPNNEHLLVRAGPRQVSVSGLPRCTEGRLCTKLLYL